MNIRTKRIHDGKKYRVIARQGKFAFVGIAKNKRQAFKQAVAGLWEMATI